MTFIESVGGMDFRVRPTDPDGSVEGITISFNDHIYLSGLTVESAEKLADLLLQAAMAMRLAGKE